MLTAAGVAATASVIDQIANEAITNMQASATKLKISRHSGNHHDLPL